MSQVLSVAKELVRLSLAGDEQDPLTSLRLQKLLYYAQGWSLVIRESELYSEEIEAWRHGPAVPRVYHELPDYPGACQLDLDAFAAAPDLEPDETEFVRCIWEAYNPYSALQLSRMTHQEKPWRNAWEIKPNDGAGHESIQVEDLEAFFAQQALPEPLEQYSRELRKKEEEAAGKLAAMPPLDPKRLAAASMSYTPAARGFLANGV